MNIFKRFKKQELFLPKVENSHLIRRYLTLMIGTFCYALSFNLFFVSNNLVFGGGSGIAIIIQKYIDPSITIFIINIICVFLCMIFLGKRATIDSIIGSLLFPIFVKLTANISSIIEIEHNLLLISIIGGVCCGLSSGLVFKSGFNTGGLDIINTIISKYLKISVGTAVFITNMIISIAASFVFGWTNVLYAIIILYIINMMIDKVVLGISNNKAVYITTDKDDEISSYLLKELNLGVTLIETRGGYTNKKDQIIMCILPTSDYFKVSEGIKEIDKNAVVFATDVYQTSKTYGSKGGDFDGVY